ncbi:MAG TPA: hypothetical protein VLI71_00305 [Gammaproteobacteria bacterium]|nr:hypothetical protein [Gammaproteobacteria bacterium]
MLAGFHGAMRLGGLLERIDFRDERRDVAGREVRHDLALQPARQTRPTSSLSDTTPALVPARRMAGANCEL